ncbi:hypothetical protein LSM04_003043 [Trypanosoma melophagium]|uniref:uncharacterized protein n=1 Tax=Trypanosoma melophagium TaxID=715481 RepID=UPI003519FEE9|nr:hypothetical protein LSM04_003043 [Trypanosoma melophagium]
MPVATAQFPANEPAGTFAGVTEAPIAIRTRCKTVQTLIRAPEGQARAAIKNRKLLTQELKKICTLPNSWWEKIGPANMQNLPKGLFSFLGYRFGNRQSQIEMIARMVCQAWP